MKTRFFAASFNVETHQRRSMAQHLLKELALLHPFRRGGGSMPPATSARSRRPGVSPTGAAQVSLRLYVYRLRFFTMYGCAWNILDPLMNRPCVDEFVSLFW